MPGHHWPFYYLHSLAISEYRRVWNHSVAFADWFLSLSNMPLRFLHVFSWLNGSFLFSGIKVHCLDGPQFIYPFNYRRRLDLTYKWPSRLWKQLLYIHLCAKALCGHKFSTPLNKCKGAWLLDHMIRVCSVLQKPPNVLKVTVPFCISTGDEWDFLLLHTLTSIWCCQCSGFDSSSRCVLVPPCSHLHLPDDIWCGASFYTFICRLSAFFGEVSN